MNEASSLWTWSRIAYWWGFVLIAIAAVLVPLLGSGTASAANAAANGARVAASTAAAVHVVGQHDAIAATTYDNPVELVDFVYDHTTVLVNVTPRLDTTPGTVGEDAGYLSLIAGSDVAANTVDDILPTPQVGSTKLQNPVNNLHKGTTNPNRVGNGTSMDAIRNEIATGVPTGGRMHTINGQETLQDLNDWQRRNPNAAYGDRLVAQSLADELSLVLRGAP